MLYVTVINQQGEILYSRSLNEFNGVDYRDKLLVKERGIKDAAMNWQAADSIKNIKEEKIKQGNVLRSLQMTRSFESFEKSAGKAAGSLCWTRHI